MSFNDFQLNTHVLKSVEDAGFTAPTPIQQQAIPLIMQGHDVRASAQTGTGKTVAYMLPLLDRMTKRSAAKKRGPFALILVPTRELAIQIASEAEKYSRHLSRVKTVCLYGGMPFPVQNRQLSRPYEILVATPGRLIDHMERKRIDLSNVELLILDEADRMLDMGFIEPVETIAQATPNTRQTLLFSATMKGSVIDLSRRLLKNPLEINVAIENAKHENIEQCLYYTDDLRHKQDILNHLLNDPAYDQTIIFTSTKRFAEQLSQELLDQGCHAAALHGDMNQRERTRTISRMRKGEIKVLVATDVAARGIDIPTITHVINFDLPTNAEDYVHRIGRTGRAEKHGRASSLASHRDRHLVLQIERYTGQKIENQIVPGMEPKVQSKPKPAGRSFGKPMSNGKPMGNGKPSHHKPYRRSGSGYGQGGGFGGGVKRERSSHSYGSR